MRSIPSVIADHSAYTAEKPFRHIVVDDFFREDFYRALCGEFKEKLARGLSDAPSQDMFSRFSWYDAYGWTIDPGCSTALQFLYSQEWKEYITGIFGIAATNDVSANLHHHKVGSGNGFVHNDYNLCSFVDEPLENGINPWFHQCIYTDDSYYKQPYTAKRVRAVAVLFYLHNEPWRSGDGGETALYCKKNHFVVAKKVAPINNRLLAFEITPQSFHGFLTNVRSPRNVLVQWFHQEPQFASARCGNAPFVPWEEGKKPFIDSLYKLVYRLRHAG